LCPRSAFGREPGSGRTACATCEHSETTGPTARCCAVAGAPIRIFYAGSRNGSFLGFNKNFGSRRHPPARFLRFVRNRVGSRLALTNFSVKTEKISGKFVGGGIFFIYLRREGYRRLATLPCSVRWFACSVRTSRNRGKSVSDPVLGGFDRLGSST